VDVPHGWINSPSRSRKETMSATSSRLSMPFCAGWSISSSGPRRRRTVGLLSPPKATPVSPGVDITLLRNLRLFRGNLFKIMICQPFITTRPTLDAADRSSNRGARVPQSAAEEQQGYGLIERRRRLSPADYQAGRQQPDFCRRSARPERRVLLKLLSSGPADDKPGHEVSEATTG
jgi:hypothetical protein